MSLIVEPDCSTYDMAVTRRRGMPGFHKKMTHYFIFKRSVAVLVATTLFLLPVSQSLACANMNRHFTKNESPELIQQQQRLRQLIQSSDDYVLADHVQIPAENIVKKGCHSQRTLNNGSDTIRQAKTLHNERKSGCKCDENCCQFTIGSAASDVAGTDTQHYSVLLPDNSLMTLKPDFLSLPNIPPPIAA